MCTFDGSPVGPGERMSGRNITKASCRENGENVWEKKGFTLKKKGRFNLHDLCFIHMHSEDRVVLQARPWKSCVGRCSCIWLEVKWSRHEQLLPWGERGVWFELWSSQWLSHCLWWWGRVWHVGTLFHSQANILALIWRVQSAHSSTKHILQVSSLQSSNHLRVLISSFSSLLKSHPSTPCHSQLLFDLFHLSSNTVFSGMHPHRFLSQIRDPICIPGDPYYLLLQQ